MSVFDKVQGAKPTMGGSYFEPDHEWLCMVNEVKKIDVRNKSEGAYIVECKVLRTSCDKVRPGADRSWYIDLMQDAAPNNLKHFGMIAGEILTGEPLTSDEVDGAGLLELAGESQPLAGQIIALTTYNKNTKAGKPFTRHKWAVPDADDLAHGQEIAIKLGFVKAPEQKAAAGSKK